MNLWPAVVQNYENGQVLMLAYMNEEAIERTKTTGLVHFWSRSRQQIWKKGETSGNLLKMHSLNWDCDQDSLLIEVQALGPTCHLNTVSCFNFKSTHLIGILETLSAEVDLSLARSGGSKTQDSIGQGASHWIRKLQEESTEIGLAVAFESNERLQEEVADLLYRLVILMKGTGLEISDVQRTLLGRSQQNVHST